MNQGFIRGIQPKLLKKYFNVLWYWEKISRQGKYDIFKMYRSFAQTLWEK